MDTPLSTNSPQQDTLKESIELPSTIVSLEDEDEEQEHDEQQNTLNTYPSHSSINTLVSTDSTQRPPYQGK